MNQVDLGFRKLFRYNRYQWSAQVDIFNFTNNDYVKTETPDSTARRSAGRRRTSSRARCGWRCRCGSKS